MDRLSKPGKAIYPGKDESEIKLLEAKYKIFLEQMEQQRKYRSEIDEVVAGWK